MARYTESMCRICRREGTKLFLKGDRCQSEKCALERRAYPPGLHGQRRRKTSDYATHLREKQKVKKSYGLLEKQFRNFFAAAERAKGVTGENLLVLLERRLDSVVYRMGFAASRAEARQVVGHRQVLVNGQTVNIPSYLVKPGDQITLHARAVNHLRIAAALTTQSQRGAPPWIEMDFKNKRGVFKALPARADLPAEINENLIVELYSK